MTSAGILAGIKVVEFSEVIAGPWGGMMLADLGAEVVKVEPLEGDPWRATTPFAPGEGRYFLSLNRGKRGLALDLRRPEGRAVVHRLVEQADVAVVNYRPDTPRNLGIDWETLSGLNPRLVYVEATAFGRRGPQAHRPGYDLIIQAVSGLMAADGKSSDGGLPIPVSPPPADFGTGYVIAWAACAGLFSRERSGRGIRIEVSLLASSLGMLGSSFLEMAGLDPPDVTEELRAAWRAGAPSAELDERYAQIRARLAGANVYYRCYETADSQVAVACLSQPLRRKFMQVIGVEDPRLDIPGALTSPEPTELSVLVLATTEIRLKERTTAEWLDMFDAVGVPAGPVNRVFELIDDPQVAANDLVVELDHPTAGPVRMLGPVIRPVGSETVPERSSPRIGQHDDEVLAELGYSSEDIARLRSDGVIL
jgi:crotonobetainyl-CoA:carnitine CoA-transferase CaiB-like acyl-CoA transferase